MRLWHYQCLPQLSRQRLLGQHRECCALRGLGWGRRHSTVDYVFRYNPWLLLQYHKRVMAEMRLRGYRPAVEWEQDTYRGFRCLPWREQDLIAGKEDVYPEHNEAYLLECQELLADGR